MKVLGLQGSPRKKGNTDHLLSVFMNAAKNLGAATHSIAVAKKNIRPCKGCGYCEKKGFCVIEDDDMKSEIYPLLRQADVIVVATPVFFYSTTAQLKALIDRCQALWARKYRLKLSDPGQSYRRGFLLALGATKGKDLFEGVHLTTKYFFDAISTNFYGKLTYRRIESPGEMEKHPTLLQEIKEEADTLLKPLLTRKKILFACRENACRSQMAKAFTQHLAGDNIEAISGGNDPASEINPVMYEVMQEKGIDMAFCKPEPIDNVIAHIKPDLIVTMGCDVDCPMIPGVKLMDWDLPDPSGKSREFMRNIRDAIQKRVDELIKSLF